MSLMKRPIGIGITHDVKNSKTSKNGAAAEVFQLMVRLRCRDPITEKAVKFFVTTRCLMICKNENFTPALRPYPSSTGVAVVAPAHSQLDRSVHHVGVDLILRQQCHRFSRDA
jgi:hypothetical protein